MKRPSRPANPHLSSWLLSSGRLALAAAAFGLPCTLAAQSPTVDTAFAAPAFTAGAKPNRVLVLSDDRFLVFSGYENPFIGFDRINGVARGDLLRYNADGSLDTTFALDAQLRADSISAVAAISGGKLFVATNFATGTTSQAKVYRLNADGSVDSAFHPGTGSGDTGALVRALAVQADGKALVGGAGLAAYDGVAGDDSLRRLNTDGSVDTAFTPTLVNDPSLNNLVAATGLSADGAIQVQPDGRIVVVGGFNAVDGTPALSVARLNANGSLDTGFVPGGYSIVSSPNSGFVQYRGVRSAALQPDGKVILAGYFNRTGSSATYQRTVRLNANGSLDSAYNAPAEFGAGGLQVRLTPAGKVLLTTSGGAFGVYNADGSVDGTFALPTLTDHYYGAGDDGYISEAAAQSDGRLVLVGGFDQANGAVRPGLARVSTAGMLDAAFTPGAISSDAAPYHLAQCAGGTILAAGAFDSVGGAARSGLALLNADGSANAATFPVSFLANASNGPDFLLQPDGKVFVYGTTPASEPDTDDTGFIYRRLNADLTVDTTLAADPSVAPFYGVSFQPGGGYLLSAGNFDGGAYIGTTNGTAGDPAFFLHRLGLSGSPDAGFVPGIDPATIFNGTGPGSGGNSTVAVGNDVALAVQPDGKILYKYFDLTSHFRLVRLNADGSADTSFQAGSATPGILPYSGYTSSYDIGEGDEQAMEIVAPSNGIDGLVVQPDGRLLLYGDLTAYNGQAVSGLLRLNANGTVDTGFGAGSGPGGVAGAGVSGLTVEGNGKLLVVGKFTAFNGVSLPGIARLNANGTVDTTFVPPALAYRQTSIGGAGTGAGNPQLVVEADDSFLLTGNYAGAGGTVLQLTRGDNLPAFFNGEATLSGGFYYLAFANGNPFGYYNLGSYPYLYHNDLGYEYVFDAKDGTGGVYLYDFESSDFFYTSPTFPFPYLYDFGLNTVLYYYPDPSNPGHYNTDGHRFFYRFDTGQIIVQ